MMKEQEWLKALDSAIYTFHMYILKIKDKEIQQEDARVDTTVEKKLMGQLAQLYQFCALSRRQRLAGLIQIFFLMVNPGDWLAYVGIGSALFEMST